jgi:molybdopterin/thiamine biosynthesis adenylyltransferase
MKPAPLLADASRYARQLVMPGIGVHGQQKLADARALVVGCGGLAATVLPQLVAAGVLHITVMDDDTVDASNLNRQVLFGEADVGARKVHAVVPRLRALDARLRLDAKNERFTPASRRLLDDHDVMLDCTDGFPNKYLLNDAAVAMRTAVVHGAATAWHGQVMSILPGTSACLRCLFPKQPSRGDGPTCQTAGILGAVVASVGSMMALEAIKLLLGQAPTSTLHTLDGQLGKWRSLHVPRDADCPACGSSPLFDGSRDADYRVDDDA